MKLSRNLTWFSFLMLGVLTTTAANSSSPDTLSHSLIQSIEDIYVNTVKENHDEFKLTQLFSKKHNKTKFLNSVFSTKVFESANNIDHSDLLITIPDAKGPWHLSIVVVAFDSDKKTNEAFNLVINKKQDYFDETKILTKYKAYKKQNKIIFIYSETFDAEPITKVFNKTSEYFSP